MRFPSFASLSVITPQGFLGFILFGLYINVEQHKIRWETKEKSIIQLNKPISQNL